MRASTTTIAFAALFSTALAQTTPSASITSMVPMMSASRAPVTMAWDDSPAPTPAATNSGAMESKASSMNAEMQSAMTSVAMESGMSISMEMESGMTMSDGTIMATGGAMAAMDGNFTGSAMSLNGKERVWWVGLAVAGLVLV